jgi:hypothetical protein
MVKVIVVAFGKLEKSAIQPNAVFALKELACVPIVIELLSTAVPNQTAPGSGRLRSGPMVGSAGPHPTTRSIATRKRLAFLLDRTMSLRLRAHPTLPIGLRGATIRRRAGR